MMTKIKRAISTWTITAFCILAGCGGGSAPGEAVPAPQQTATPAQMSSNHAVPDTAHPIYNGTEFHALKFLINVLGTQDLKNHLVQFKTSSQDSGEANAAEKFIGIIDKFSGLHYPTAAELEYFLADLQALPAFAKTERVSDVPAEMIADSRAHDFLEQIAKLFRLKTMPGWSTKNETTMVRGQDKETWTLRNIFGMDQFFGLDFTASKPYLNNNVHKGIEFLHQTFEKEMKWKSSDSHESKVTYSHRTIVDNVGNFKRFTLYPIVGQFSHDSFNLNDRARFIVYDEQSKQNVALQLELKEILMTEDHDDHYVLIRDERGTWATHKGLSVKAVSDSDLHGHVQIFNFAVVDRAPAAGISPGPAKSSAAR